MSKGRGEEIHRSFFAFQGKKKRPAVLRERHCRDGEDPLRKKKEETISFFLLEKGGKKKDRRRQSRGENSEGKSGGERPLKRKGKAILHLRKGRESAIRKKGLTER